MKEGNARDDYFKLLFLNSSHMQKLFQYVTFHYLSHAPNRNSHQNHYTMIMIVIH